MNSKGIKPGFYVGVCNNHTAGLSANMLLFLNDSIAPRIHGELGLFGDLAGGGSFHGKINGRDIAFNTCDPSIQLVIDWQGSSVGTDLRGSYAAICDHPEARSQGVQHQQGVWSVRLVRPLGEASPNGMNLVSVFDGGHCHGPFPVDDFASQVDAGRWPDSVIVGFDDLTTWCSLHELKVFLQSQAEQTRTQCQSSFGEDIAKDTGKKVISGILASIVLAAFGFGD